MKFTVDVKTLLEEIRKINNLSLTGLYEFVAKELKLKPRQISRWRSNDSKPTHKNFEALKNLAQNKISEPSPIYGKLNTTESQGGDKNMMAQILITLGRMEEKINNVQKDCLELKKKQAEEISKHSGFGADANEGTGR